MFLLIFIAFGDTQFDEYRFGIFAEKKRILFAKIICHILSIYWLENIRYKPCEYFFENITLYLFFR